MEDKDLVFPEKLIQLICPHCDHAHWAIDVGLCWDPRRPHIPGYCEREYTCPVCGVARTGFELLDKSPPSFLSQPDDTRPMSTEVFKHWADVLKRTVVRYRGSRRFRAPQYPVTPSLRQLLETTLPILSFLCKVRGMERAIFGDSVTELDWPCLTLAFE